MSSPDWQELERLWQSSSEATQAKDKDLIIRAHRRAWLRYLTIAGEILSMIMGVALSIFLMVTGGPDARWRAAILLVFTLSAAAFSLWARRAPKEAAEQAVITALDTAIHRVRVRARVALAHLWVNGLAMLVCAVLAAHWTQADTYTTRQVHLYLHACAYWFGALGVVQLCAIPYYLRRVRELQRLEDIRQGLREMP